MRQEEEGDENWKEKEEKTKNLRELPEGFRPE